VIDPSLFAEPIVLDRAKHAKTRLKVQGLRADRTAGMNAMFIAAVEFIDVAREYPIVFVEAGKGPDGQREIAPMAVLGLAQGENLVLQPDGSWGARYVPLGMGQTPDGQYLVVVDGKADALSDTEGDRIFDDLGQPTPAILQRRDFLEKLEAETQRTRAVGRALIEHDLLTTMRFDATLPDGSQVAADGFLAVDDKKFNELADAKLVALHRSGVLGLIHAHLFSMGLMGALAEKRWQRLAAKG
jgi:SapC